MYTISQLYDLEHTSAKDYLSRFTYPWEALKGIKEMILDVYEAAMSHPYPEEWLGKCLDIYQVKDKEALESSEWMELLWKTCLEELEEV